MTIPGPVAKALKFQDGDRVEVGIKDGAMIVKKVE